MLIGEIFDEFIHVIHENQKYTIGLINENKEVALCSDTKMISKTVDYNIRIKTMFFLKLS